MKYLIALFLFTTSLVMADTTPWTSFPTTNTFGDSDTFIIGNGSTNLILSGVKTIITNSAQAIANTTSNSLQTGINNLGTSLTNDVNTTSNSLNSSINTSSNLLNGTINTSSNSVYGNATNGSIQATANFFAGTTNMVAFTNGPPVAGQAFVIVGTNTAGVVLVKGTNWPTGSGGTATLMPPNALGVLTNNGSGATNWSTSFPGTWIGTGTLPNTSVDSTWMPITNAVAYTNGPPTAGQALVVVGTNSFGAVLTKGTNWPSGGGSQTPWSSDINGAQFALTNFNRMFTTNVTGQFQINSNTSVLSSNGVNSTYTMISTNHSIHLGSNSVDTVVLRPTDGSIVSSNLTVNGGNSNWLGGFTRLEAGPWLILTNAAPAVTNQAKTWFVVTNNAGVQFLIPGY